MSSPAAAAVQELLRQNRPEQALAAIEPVARAESASHSDLHAYAQVLKVLMRREEALEVQRRAARENPASAVAEHNLASTLGDLGRWEEAEAACRRALAKGGDAPETWQVLGRALMNLQRMDEAEAALAEAIARRPTFGDAHRDLAQLVWMRSGDADATVASLGRAQAAHPQSAELAIEYARALHYAGRSELAFSVITEATARAPQPDYMLEIIASSVALMTGKSAAALDHATRAMMIRPNDIGAGLNATDAYLGLGQADMAAKLAQKLYTAAPADQRCVCRLATAWRITGDSRHKVLYDYENMVRPYVIDTPPGWADLPAYLSDLAAALKRLHAFETHPFDQSLRGGSQTSHDLTTAKEPAVQAFLTAIDGPIRRYMDEIGPGTDILRRRNTKAYGFAGIWSVMLRPNGFHVDHIHPAGWLSSACYIELPEAVNAGEKEGWIKFGQPGIPTDPPLPPEHYVQPAPGTLVLFPSYMWHGTVPFSGDTNRLTIAFDVTPTQVQ